MGGKQTGGACAYRSLIGKQKGKDYLGGIGIGRSTILKWILSRVLRCGLCSMGSG
jgi:hypothetical protein